MWGVGALDGVAKIGMRGGRLIGVTGHGTHDSRSLLLHRPPRTVLMLTPSFLAAASSFSGSAGSTQAVTPVLGCVCMGGMECGSVKWW